MLLFGTGYFMAGRFAHYLVGSGAGYLILERRGLVYHLRHLLLFPKPPLKLITPQAKMSTTHGLRKYATPLSLHWITSELRHRGERDRGFPPPLNPRVPYGIPSRSVSRLHPCSNLAIGSESRPKPSFLH